MPVFANFVEGNHWFQTASHFLFGYNIGSPYPQFRPTRDKDQIIPDISTLQRRTQVKVFFPLYQDDNKGIEHLRKISSELQLEKQQVIEPTMEEKGSDEKESKEKS